MSERGGRAPFYAPPRRKTSAEIISEARAAICAEMKAADVGASGGLRALRTRRPFTPREPQRVLFAERARTRVPRPPSAFDLKYLSVSEGSEDASALSEPSAVSNADEHAVNEILLAESQNTARKKPPVRNQARAGISEGWAGLPKLPHLSGRSKPLHRRNTTTLLADEALNSDTSSKRKYFAAGKSLSCDSGATRAAPLGDVAVKHLAVQLPINFQDDYENMSLLELSDGLCTRGGDVERTLSLLRAVQAGVAAGGAARGELRDHVLRALYTHIDSDDESVLVAIARAMFTMRVTGPHLAAACKLIFKIARNDKNDHFFKDSNLLELLVEGCGRADPVAESECCVYAAGALRFLALEPRLCALAHRAGALHLAALHLKILNNAVSEQATHALYQVTGALRNLAGAGSGAGGATECARAFVSSGALAELVAALQVHTDRDVLTNVARCLSVVSVEASCCAWLCGCAAAARALLRALAACATRAPLAVRLAYTLGNMAAADHRARINIYKEEGGVDVLLTVLESYTARRESSADNRDPDADPDLHLIGSDLGGSDGSNEDVLIKTVRVVANLCLSETAGRGLVRGYAERTAGALLACLRVAETLADKVSNSKEDERHTWTDGRDELATAVLATINNVTFYMEAPSSDALDEILDSLCIAACRWASGVHGAGGAAACEAVRALGNLTRTARAAQLAVLEGALDALPPFQRHVDESVRCAAAGVLVNVCGAGAGAVSGAAAAARALHAAAVAGDSQCAALLARALWNAHAHRPLQPADAHQAAAALASFIDDDSVFEACEVAGPGGAGDLHQSRHHVKFELDNETYHEDAKHEVYNSHDALEAGEYSVEEQLDVGRLERESDVDCNGTGCSGEDLGFEDGEMEECECAPCRRLAVWEELVAIAIPLLEKLKPPRADASVGTE